MNIKDEKKPGRILNVASKLIVKQGTAAISTVQVAKKMGIAQSNIYLYYANKQALLRAVYLHAVDALSDYATENVRTDTPIVRQIEHFVRVLYDFSVKDPQSMAIIEIFKHAPNLDLNLTVEQKNSTNQQIQAILQQCADEGILRTRTVDVPRNIIFETMHFYADSVQRGALTANNPDVTTVVEMILAAILNPTLNAQRLAAKENG